MTRALPVAQGGMEANIGAKKMDTKNIRPVTIAAIPVFPPSANVFEQHTNVTSEATYLQYLSQTR